MVLMQPGEEFDRLRNLLLGYPSRPVGGLPRRSVSTWAPQGMRGGELFDWCSYSRGRDGVEFGGQPGLEPREVFIARCQQTVVFEQAAQMRDVCALPCVVETLMAERDVTGSQPSQQCLHLGGAFP